MPKLVVYYHDPVEVDRTCSWTGLCSALSDGVLVDVKNCTDLRVTDLFLYARPDAVITLNGVPIVSIEQTAMNPSGHNIPQRFSFHARAAELGVPSILYYPEYSRRTFSDPNVRYVQVRVPLAQKRLSSIYRVPALSVFWPTNPETLLPDTKQSAHSRFAQIIDALIENAGDGEQLLQLPEIQAALKDMDRVVAKHEGEYRSNRSVRTLLKEGFDSAKTISGTSIDPPDSCQLMTTEAFIKQTSVTRSSNWSPVEKKLLHRKHTMVFTGTANKARVDSEHPWPGYLTLLDVLYLRDKDGRTPNCRSTNLVYRLPVSAPRFLDRLNQSKQPTATRIVDRFADILWLGGALVAGVPIRGYASAELFRLDHV